MYTEAKSLIGEVDIMMANMKVAVSAMTISGKELEYIEASLPSVNEAINSVYGFTCVPYNIAARVAARHSAKGLADTVV